MKSTSDHCPSGWVNQGFQCIKTMQGPCCISDTGYELNADHSLGEYCKIEEVKTTEWYGSSATHCPEGFSYGEEYNPLGECKQDNRNYYDHNRIPFC